MQGKFLFLGQEKLYVRGATHGPLRPGPNGCEYHNRTVIEHDLRQMATAGFNAIRTYTVPPRWFLDLAQQHGLWVMVGLPWEQHVAFLTSRENVRSIEHRVRDGIRACAGHPAILAYAVGNEIPAPIVRWHGARAVERFLRQLYETAKEADPTTLVTYVNYPTTEYLELPFFDLACFNVYLEAQEKLKAYVARLHNTVGDRPLLLTELGLDSSRHGAAAQAETLAWQIRNTMSSGCAGAFIFSWTDEWYRGDEEILDWQFGLTTRERKPKPALHAVQKAFAATPFPNELDWPRISVVVCSYNGSRTIRDCCRALRQLDYPDYEVIVVDDGSTDAVGTIAAEFGFRVIRTTRQGLSAARNSGLAAATGEIVAYTDDDAYPDAHWLRYLALAFANSSYAGIGGPNLLPADEGLVAECVGRAPGGPIHVLLSDQEAEHIPGVNMAFRKHCLEAIGGFDPRFWVAGDDVDVCWRLQERGWKLGFSPAAVVWHHPRRSIRGYWKQQTGYGRAEALLESKWPEKYNGAGHFTWGGRVYGSNPHRRGLWRRGRIYQGTWGSAPFQSLYEPASNSLWSLVLMPEWWLVIVALAALSTLGLFWSPFLLSLPLLLLAVGLPSVHALYHATNAAFPTSLNTRRERCQRIGLATLLTLVQPLARLSGRLGAGLTIWRRYTEANWSPRLLILGPRLLRLSTLWNERWHSTETWLHALEVALRSHGAVVRRGDNFDRWDLEIRTGTFAALRLLMAIEEHGRGRQLLRFRIWPYLGGPVLWVGLLMGALVAGATLLGDRSVVLVLVGLIALLMIRILGEIGSATNSALLTLRAIEKQIREEGHHRPPRFIKEKTKGEIPVHHNGHSRSAKVILPAVHDQGRSRTVNAPDAANKSMDDE